METNLPVIGTIQVGSDLAIKNWWGNSVISEYAIPLLSEIPILQKLSYDAFHNTCLEDTLIQNTCNQVIITGAMTHLCCETTARTAFIKGYEVIMVIDALVDKEDKLMYCN